MRQAGTPATSPTLTASTMPRPTSRCLIMRIPGLATLRSSVEAARFCEASLNGFGCGEAPWSLYIQVL